MVLENAEGLCPGLLNTVFPVCMAYASGGELPWENENGEAKITYPDLASRVVVILKRI